MNEEPLISTVVLVRGLPGSGKTYIVGKLLPKLDALEVISLDPDAVDMQSEEYRQHVEEQTGEGVDPALQLYRFLRAQAFAGIASGKLVIWNQPFTNLEMFRKITDNFYRQAEAAHRQLQLLVVEVFIDAETAKQRVGGRKQAGGHGPSDTAFERFINDFSSFENEGYDVLKVEGTDPDGAVHAILARLTALGLAVQNA